MNPFFNNHGPFKLSEFSNSKISHLVQSDELTKNDSLIYDVKNVNEATSKDITFFHSIKYKGIAINTNAFACITKTEFDITDQIILIVNKDIKEFKIK